MTSINIDIKNIDNKSKLPLQDIKVENKDCLTNQRYCSIEHKELTKRLRKHFMPHLNNSCHIPLVNWCEKFKLEKKSKTSELKAIIGSKDSYLIKLDTCLYKNSCFTPK
jgi:hypothetical protein